MPAGTEPAGIGPAGHSSATGTDATPASALSATLFDGASKDFVELEDGRWQATHPIDQAVALSVLVEQGTIAGAPTVGSTLRQITHVGGKGFESDVRDRVLTSNPLARLIRQGDVVVSAVLVEQTQGGGFMAALEYFNMRDQPNKKRRAEATIF